jgi:alkyl hydroperoxide reductase subunit F
VVYELMIIGGGPAGLTAAVYAARKQIKTLLISGDIGGQINWTLGVENYMGYQFIEGPELIAKFENQVGQFPIEQKIGDKVARLRPVKGGFSARTEAGETYRARAVIIATGKRPRKLEVPGEVELTGRGVAYCAVCDGPVFAGQRVAVVGGGNSALEAALDMVKIAEHVDLVSLTTLTGDPLLIDRLKGAKNLTRYLEYQTEAVRGKDFVEGLSIKAVGDGKREELDVTGVFIEIGTVPNSDVVKGLAELNRMGEVVVNCNTETSIPGLYAAGDATSVPEKQIIVAAGEGAKAALQAHRYLQRLAK